MTSAWPHKEFPESIKLPPLGHLPGHTHRFDAKSVWAIRGALAARRPLLVRGEPGTGKSELARAAAWALRRPLVSEVISSRTESADLHYHFDAVARLGRAQVLGTALASGARSEQGVLDVLEERHFVQPGPLWWVFHWEGARTQNETACVKGARPAEPDAEWNWRAEHGTVLLIDEIDKADADVPNGLLESLGNGEFHVPHLDMPICAVRGHNPPLVVITTNEERELPAAFLRRCLVLHLALPTGEQLAPFLIERGRAHFGKAIGEAVYAAAAKQLAEDRAQAESENLPKPGQAEYLDLLRAVLELAGKEPAEQRKILDELAGFALQKNPPVTS